MNNTNKCCKRVFTGQRYDIRGHICNKKAVVERDGLPYCRIHDPVEVKAKADARTAKWKAENEAAMRRHQLHSAAPALLKACLDMLALLPENWGDNVHDGTITFYVDEETIFDMQKAVGQAKGKP